MQYPQREYGVISQTDMSRQSDMYNQEDMGPHNRRPIKPPAQSGEQPDQGECSASKADPLEIIDWDDRRPGYDPDKGEHSITLRC